MKTLDIFMHTPLHRCYVRTTYMRTYSVTVRFFSLYECSAFIVVRHFTFRSIIHSRVQNKGQYNIYASNEIFSIVHIQRVLHKTHTHTHTHTHTYIYIYIYIYKHTHTHTHTHTYTYVVVFCIQEEEGSFYQHIGLGIEEEASEGLRLEHSFIWC